MQSLKDKMYNYEVQPPSQSWQLIIAALDSDKVKELNSPKKKSKLIYYSLGIAAAIVVFIFSTVFFNDSNKKVNKISAGNSKNSRITVPETSTGKNNSETDNIAFESSKKYLLICGPEGQPVKISSKAAKLIVASDNQNPPTPVWSAKVEKWKDIMETNILAPTTGNFLDIVELTQVLNK